MTKTVQFDKFDVILKWWIQIDQGRQKLKKRGDFTTADSAILRRAKTIDEIMMSSPAYYKLLERLSDGEALSKSQQKKIAIIAGVLAHVRENSPETLAKHLKKLAAKSDSVELRFRRLVQESESDDIFRSLIRAVKLTGESANVLLLAKSIYFWSDPSTKKQWAYDFY